MKNETKKTNEIAVVVTLYCLTAMVLCTPVGLCTLLQHYSDLTNPNDLIFGVFFCDVESLHAMLNLIPLPGFWSSSRSSSLKCFLQEVFQV